MSHTEGDVLKTHPVANKQVFIIEPGDIHSKPLGFKWCKGLGTMVKLLLVDGTNRRERTSTPVKCDAVSKPQPLLELHSLFIGL